MQKVNKLYPFYTWTASLILGPLIYASTISVLKDNSEPWIFFCVCIIIGGCLSIPSLIIGYLTFNYLTKRGWSAMRIKFILFLLALLFLQILLVSVYNFEPRWEHVFLNICCTLGTLFSLTFFKIYSDNSDQSTMMDYL
jgi:hypothetical protein